MTNCEIPDIPAGELATSVNGRGVFDRQRYRSLARKPRGCRKGFRLDIAVDLPAAPARFASPGSMITTAENPTAKCPNGVVAQCAG
jgi:hypothetical protein